MTGALKTDAVFAFDAVLDWSYADPTEIARHPVEAGKKAVTDARQKALPKRLQATFLLTDTPEEPNLFSFADLREADTFKGAFQALGSQAKAGVSTLAARYDPRNWRDNVDRSLRRYADFERFAAGNDPITVSLPGITLRRMGIGVVQTRPQGTALHVTVSFEELRIVTLRTVAQIPDADLAAAGFGGGGAAGSTFVEVGVFGGG